ncbi:hypothetical protein ABTM69_19570, partial [Acinetobacter baumannii]
MVRLTATGGVDGTFDDPNLDDIGRSVALQADRKILVGGFFAKAGAASADYLRLARFNVGSVRLSVATPTNGAVTSDAGGINCGATCSGLVASGTSLTLTATPSVGYVFTGWGGGCSGTTNPLTVTL